MGVKRDIKVDTKKNLFPLEGELIDALEFHGFSSFQVKDKSQAVMIIIETPPQEINAFVGRFCCPDIHRAHSAGPKKHIGNATNPDEKENGRYGIAGCRRAVLILTRWLTGKALTRAKIIGIFNKK
jgi:hypothetical protein